MRYIVLSMLWCLLIGCSTAGQTNDVTDLSADPDDWPAHSFATEAGLHHGQFQFDGHDRQFAIYLPDDFAQRTGPLVFVFHGGGGNADRIRHLDFEQYADDDGGIIIYPQGIDGNWADGRGTTPAEQQGVDDVAFVTKLLEMTEQNLPADYGPVVATGPSNGGMMSFRLGCQAADHFDVIAPVIAALPSALSDDCHPQAPFSLVGIQGTEDPFIDIDGGDAAHRDRPALGEGGDVESAEATMLHFAEVLQCDLDPQSTRLSPIDEDDPSRVDRFRFTDCGQQQRLHYYIVDGMGHTWPPLGGVFPRISGPSSAQLDATATIWEFARSHRR